jgi:DNA repair protein RadC
MARAADIIGIPLVDHVIVGGERHASLFELGLFEHS